MSEFNRRFRALLWLAFLFASFFPTLAICAVKWYLANKWKNGKVNNQIPNPTGKTVLITGAPLTKGKY